MDIHALIPPHWHDPYEEQRYQSLYDAIELLGFRLPVPALSKIIAIDRSSIFLGKEDKFIYENYLNVIKKLENQRKLNVDQSTSDSSENNSKKAHKVKYNSWKDFPLSPSNFKIFNLVTNNMIGYGRQVHFRIPYEYSCGFNRMAVLKNLRIPKAFQRTISTITLSSGGQIIDKIPGNFFQALRYIYQINDEEIIPIYCLSNQCFPIPVYNDIIVEIEFDPYPQHNIELENFKTSMEWYPLTYFLSEIYYYNAHIAEEYLSKIKELSILELDWEYYYYYQVTDPMQIKFPCHFNMHITHILISLPYDKRNKKFLSTTIHCLNLKFNNYTIKINPKKLKKYENFYIIPFIDPIHPNLDNDKDQFDNLVNFTRINHIDIEMSINLPMISNIEIFYGAINVNALVQDRSFVSKLLSK